MGQTSDFAPQGSIGDTDSMWDFNQACFVPFDTKLCDNKLFSGLFDGKYQSTLPCGSPPTSATLTSTQETAVPGSFKDNSGNSTSFIILIGLINFINFMNLMSLIKFIKLISATIK